VIGDQLSIILVPGATRANGHSTSIVHNCLVYFGECSIEKELFPNLRFRDCAALTYMKVIERLSRSCHEGRPVSLKELSFPSPGRLHITYRLAPQTDAEP
jgi:hypothetical protein